MRGVTVALPEPAREKLAEIELQRAQTEDAQRSCRQRLNALPTDADGLRAQLTSERDKLAAQYRQLSMLRSRINQWHMELRLPPGSKLEPAPAIDIKLKPGETLKAAIEAVREKIADVQLRELAQVRRAPLRKQSQLQAVSEYLTRLAAGAAENRVDARGNARVMWAEDMVAGKDDVLGLLAFALGPEQLLAAFSRDLELEPEPADALSSGERDKRISELSDSLLSLERREEGLMRAAQDGIDVLRRGDADPRCVLGVTVIKAQAQVA